MSTGTLIPLAIADQVARKLVNELDGVCGRIAIAGSIRRKKPQVGDIELVAIPRYGTDLFGHNDPKRNYLNGCLNGLIHVGKIFKTPSSGTVRPAWGERYKKFWLKVNDEYGEIQVDLFICTPDNWGNIFTIRTGSSAFSEAVVTRMKYHTPYRQEDGFLIDSRTGERVSVPTERDYFKLAGIGWVNPENRRSADSVRPAVATHEENESPSARAPQLEAPTEPQIALTTQIKAQLQKIDGLHPTVLIPRLGCSLEDFTLAVRALKLLGEIRENHYGGLHLIRRDSGGNVAVHKTDTVSVLTPVQPEIVTDKTHVVNVRDLPDRWQDDPRYVYIGRANAHYGLAQSKYSNPFTIAASGNRVEACYRFEQYLRERSTLLGEARRDLRGKTLECWCAPLPCHGDVLIRLMNESEPGGIVYTTDEAVRASIRRRLEEKAGIG